MPPGRRGPTRGRSLRRQGCPDGNCGELANTHAMRQAARVDVELRVGERRVMPFPADVAGSWMGPVVVAPPVHHWLSS